MFYVLQVVKSDYKNDACLSEKVKEYVENEKICNESFELSCKCKVDISDES